MKVWAWILKGTVNVSWISILSQRNRFIRTDGHIDRCQDRRQNSLNYQRPPSVHSHVRFHFTAATDVSNKAEHFRLFSRPFMQPKLGRETCVEALGTARKIIGRHTSNGWCGGKKYGKCCERETRSAFKVFYTRQPVTKSLKFYLYDIIELYKWPLLPLANVTSDY